VEMVFLNVETAAGKYICKRKKMALILQTANDKGITVSQKAVSQLLNICFIILNIIQTYI
jgi:hypothetical protein